MKTCLFAATDLKLETSKEQFNFSKGAMIQVEAGSDDNVYVVHHRLIREQGYEKKAGDACARQGKSGTLQNKTNSKGESKLTCVVPGQESMDFAEYDMPPKYKVESTYLKFMRMEDLRFFAGATVMETQLADEIDLVDIPLSDALLVERLTPACISKYLNETSSLQRIYVKEGVEYVRLPVKPRDKALEIHEKVKLISEFDKIDASKIKSEDIVALTARNSGNANQTGHIVALEVISQGNISRGLPGYLKRKISESVPADWKVRIVDGSIRVSTNGARPAPLFNLLATLPVKTHIEQEVNHGEDMFYKIGIAEKAQEKVVESYYTKSTSYEKYELVEADAEDRDEGKTPKEGDECTSDGKKGKLTKQGDSLVCVVKEAMDMTFDEDIQEGDICEADDKYGVIKLVEGNLCCVITSSQENDKGIKETVETIAYAIPKEAVSNNGSTGDGAMPKVGDSCEFQGKQGTLALQNGALICSLGGTKPEGAEGAN